MRCGECLYFRETPIEVTPSLSWSGEVQNSNVIEYDFEGICENEANWRPSRGEMPCDKDFRCGRFERKVEKHE